MNMIYEKHFRHLNFNTEQAIIVMGVTGKFNGVLKKCSNLPKAILYAKYDSKEQWHRL